MMVGEALEVVSFPNRFFKVIIGAVIIGAIFDDNRAFCEFISVICIYCRIRFDVLTDCMCSVTRSPWRDGFSGFTGHNKRFFGFSCFLTSKKLSSRILNRSAQTYARHYNPSPVLYCPIHILSSKLQTLLLLLPCQVWSLSCNTMIKTH